MNKSLSNLLTLIFAAIGCIVTLVLTFGEHVSTAATGCFKSGEGCASTTGSVYGHIGPIPTSIIGLLMYLAFLALCLLRGKQLRLARDREATRAAAYASSAAIAVNQTSEDADINGSEQASIHPERSEISATAPVQSGLSVRMLDMLVWGLALLGFGISVWLQYIAIYQLHSFCKYCFASATLVTLIFALASRDYLLDGRELTGEQKMIGGVLALILVLGSFMIVPDIIDIATHPKPPVLTAKPVPDARGAITASLLHTKGDPKAKYTLVEFADYQCPHCAEAAKEVEELIRTRKDIRLAFRNYPLVMIHKWGMQAAAAAEAAGEQSKFWEMHDLLFQHTKDINEPTFEPSAFDDYARSLKLDVAKFDKDRASEKITSRVDADVAAGNVGHVETTPTFFFVAPTHVTSLPGTKELNKFLDKPNTKDWE